MLASRAAKIPVRKIPSNVPAPPIEATGAPEPLDLVEIEEVGADQGAEAAADVGQRRRVPARQQQCDDCRRCRRHKYRERDPQAGNRLSEGMAHHGDTGGGEKAANPQLISDAKIERQQTRDHRAADIDGDDRAGPLDNHRDYIMHAEERDLLP